MKTTIKCFGVCAAMLVFTLTSCTEPDNSQQYLWLLQQGNNADKVINIAAIQGVTPPAVGGTPATEITETAQYTGTVAWSPPVPTVFQLSTVYFATITLTPKSGYILEGVTKDFFTVQGANRVNNDENSGVIIVIFPTTAGTNANPAVIDIPIIEGITPVIGETPKTAINPTAQYTGTVTWSPGGNLFTANTKYTATITLIPRAGFTFTGVAAGFFTVKGSETTTNEANSNIITSVFTLFLSIDDLESYLQVLPDNTAATPYIIALNSQNDFSKLKTILRNNPTKYVYLDLSGSNITYIPYFAFSTSSNYSDYESYTGCATLTGITIPNGVTSIGVGAFRECTSLASITIGNNVIGIGGYAFSGCTSLASVTIPDSVTSIGYDAFYNCTSLASVTIPNSVTSIEKGTFYSCTSLASVTIPNSVTSIGYRAFEGCTSLASITIGSSVSSIEYSAFNGTAWENSLPDGLTYIGKVAYKYKGYMTANTSIILRDGTTQIFSEAFYGCTNLTGITIPNSVTSIGYSVFQNCTSLTSVTIPNSVTSIGYRAFEGCTSLASVTIPNSVTYISGFTFYGCTGLTNVTIPNSVTSIGEEAFSGCTSLASVTIPNGVTSIDYKAFYGCTSLASVTIPNSVTSIGGSAFRSCTSLAAINVDTSNTAYSSQDGVLYNKDKTTLILYPAKKTASSFYIPNSVTSIEEEAFSGCASLASVTIPSSVTTIGDCAFMGCKNLASVTFATGSNISDANFGNWAFPEESYGGSGNRLQTAYSIGKAGTYTRESGGSTWTKIN